MATNIEESAVEHIEVKTEEQGEASGTNGVRAIAMGKAQLGTEKLLKMGVRTAVSVADTLGKLRSGSTAKDALEEGVPLYLDPEEEYAREKAERLREWPEPVEGKTASVLDLFGYRDVDEGRFFVRNDGKRMAVFEVSGRTLDEPTVAAFAGALNSMQGHVQFLIRQHPPRLNQLRIEMRSRYEWVEDNIGLSPSLSDAAESLDDMLSGMEERPGLLDRRFYIICEEKYIDDVTAAMGRVNLVFAQMGGTALDILIRSVAFGQSPASLPQHDRIAYRVHSRYVKSDNNHFRRTIHVKVLPRLMTDSFVSSILLMGVPLDMSFHITPISSNQALANLKSQLTRMQASANGQMKRKGMVEEKERVAIEDLLRMRSAVMRGFERMFNVSLMITVHGQTLEKVNEHVNMLRSILTSVVAQVDDLPRIQGNALVCTMPLCDNRLNRWTTADTSTLALMFPFNPPDIDTRHGTLMGVDLNAGSLVTYDMFDSPEAQNMNMAILATSGAGKSFTAKLTILRQMTRGVRVYVIDPEGEYVDSARAAGGKILTPGVPNQGMNPFVVTETGPELMERVQNLVNLLQVMIGRRLDPTDVANLDDAVTSYYEQAIQHGEQGTWKGLYSHIKQREPKLATMLKRFSTGSMRYLLSDEGNDLLMDEAPITVFSLQLLKDDMRAAAAVVCAETVWTMATRDPRPRMLVVDEVWSIIQDPEGAAFMMNSAKRARKHMLGLTSITQDVSDLLAVNSSEGVKGNSGRSLITNAAYKLLLRQDPAAADVIEDTFQLPNGIARRLSSYPTGQGLLITPMGRCTIQIEASNVEADIIKWEGGAY